MMFGGWVIGAGVFLSLALIAVVVGVALRRTGSGGSGVVRTALWVSIVWAVIGALGAIVTTLAILLSDEVGITVPVQTFWPELPSGTEVDMGTAERVGGGFTSADLVLTGLSVGARGTWAVSQALWWILPAAVAVLLALACSRLLAGQPFAPIVTRAASVTAIVIAIGGVLAAVLGDVAGSMAAAETLAVRGGSYQEVAGIEDVFQAWIPRPALDITLPFWPIAGGLAFGALAAVFRYGAALQHETRGLV